MDTGPISGEKPHMRITPESGFWLPYLRDIFMHKDLVYLLVAKEIKVRYKQTILGGLWAIIQPFFSMVVFTLFFGRLAKIPSDGIPYPIFNYSAMVAWTYFSSTVASAGNSLVGNTDLITKVYFPRVIIPVSPILAGILDFFLAFAVLIGMMYYFDIHLSKLVLATPALVLIMVTASAGVGIFLSALNVKYRDVRYTIPFILQLWMFVSPIVYPLSLVPTKYKWVYSLNPMVGVIEGFRSALLGSIRFPLDAVLTSAGGSILLLVCAVAYFRGVEKFFADII